MGVWVPVEVEVEVEVGWVGEGRRVGVPVWAEVREGGSRWRCGRAR